MAEVRCVHCKELVDAKATTCPHCRNSPRPLPKGCIRAIVVAVAVIAVWTLIYNVSGQQHRDAVKASGGDVLGVRACANFTTLVEDTQAGTVTDAEFRTRMQSIYDDARYADTVAVADGARTVLADETAGSDDSDDITALASACIALSKGS